MAKLAKGVLSTTGLVASDEKLLRACLKGLQPILDKPGLLGGNELDRARSLERRLKNRLAPESPETLATEAQAFVRQFGHVPEQSRLNEQRRQAAIAEAEAVREKAFAAHRKRVAVLAETERLRVAEMVEASEGRQIDRTAAKAVSEVI